MKLFSYVVARDFGFAPNPFFGVCTLATCKPRIRKKAEVGDLIVGTGSKGRGREGHLVFAMRVSETLTFNKYWEIKRFRKKRPNLQGSLKQAFGDNIYFRDKNDNWHQLDSHHSYANGTPNMHNICNDTQTDRVLVATHYAYWGGHGPSIDQAFRNYEGYDVCAGRNHKSKFPDNLVRDISKWLRSLNQQGYLGDPLDWPKA